MDGARVFRFARFMMLAGACEWCRSPWMPALVAAEHEAKKMALPSSSCSRCALLTLGFNADQNCSFPKVITKVKNGVQPDRHRAIAATNARLIQYLHKFQLDAKYSTVSPTVVSMCIASSARFICSNLSSGSAMLPEPHPRPLTWGPGSQ